MRITLTIILHLVDGQSTVFIQELVLRSIQYQDVGI